MPTASVEVAKITVTNRGGLADEHQVRLIEASDMYAGLHRAISYCLLSYVHEQLVETATQNAPIQVYQRRTFDNCLTHELFVGAVGGGVGNLLSGAAIPLLGLFFKAAVGMMRGSEYEERLRLFRRVEPFADDLVNVMEPHLAQIHRPIHTSETVEIDLGGVEQITLDEATKDYVSTGQLTEDATTFSGNVTRLNVVTGNGRFYANELVFIIPFSQPQGFRKRQTGRPLSWSLRQADRNQPSDIQVDARQFTSSSGRLKRLMVVDSRLIVSPPS